jgi:hypothetical protein
MNFEGFDNSQLIALRENWIDALRHITVYAAISGHRKDMHNQLDNITDVTEEMIRRDIISTGGGATT